MVLVSIFMEGTSVLGTFYSLITLCMWSFAIALVSTTCLVALPLTKWKQSRFERFLQNVVERNVQLGKLQYHSKKGLILAVFLFIISAVTVIVAFLQLPNFTVARYKPWNGLHMDVLVIFSLIYQIYSLSIWLLPILFFCMTCLVLERLFDCFCARVSAINSNSLDLIAIKDEHQNLCETLRLAGDIFSPLLLEIVAVYIPLLCFNFYAAVNPPPSDNEGSSILLSAIGGLYWLVGSSSILAVITVFGSRVNEKVSKIIAYFIKCYTSR